MKTLASQTQPEEVKEYKPEFLAMDDTPPESLVIISKEMLHHMFAAMEMQPLHIAKKRFIERLEMCEGKQEYEQVIQSQYFFNTEVGNIETFLYHNAQL